MNLPTTVALVAVAAGGAIGSVLRFLTGGWVARRMMAGHPEMALPVATMLVNVAGSFLIGLLIAWMEQFVRDPALRDGLRAFLIVGVLGGFTTFSTFSPGNRPTDRIRVMGQGIVEYNRLGDAVRGRRIRRSRAHALAGMMFNLSFTRYSNPCWIRSS